MDATTEATEPRQTTDGASEAMPYELRMLVYERLLESMCSGHGQTLLREVSKPYRPLESCFEVARHNIFVRHPAPPVMLPEQSVGGALDLIIAPYLCPAPPSVPRRAPCGAGDHAGAMFVSTGRADGGLVANCKAVTDILCGSAEGGEFLGVPRVPLVLPLTTSLPGTSVICVRCVHAADPVERPLTKDFIRGAVEEFYRNPASPRELAQLYRILYSSFRGRSPIAATWIVDAEMTASDLVKALALYVDTPRSADLFVGLPSRLPTPEEFVTLLAKDPTSISRRELVGADWLLLKVHVVPSTGAAWIDGSKLALAARPGALNADRRSKRPVRGGDAVVHNSLAAWALSQ